MPKDASSNSKECNRTRYSHNKGYSNSNDRNKKRVLLERASSMLTNHFNKPFISKIVTINTKNNDNLDKKRKLKDNKLNNAIKCINEANTLLPKEKKDSETDRLNHLYYEKIVKCVKNLLLDEDD